MTYRESMEAATYRAHMEAMRLADAAVGGALPEFREFVERWVARETVSSKEANRLKDKYRDLRGDIPQAKGIKIIAEEACLLAALHGDNPGFVRLDVYSLKVWRNLTLHRVKERASAELVRRQRFIQRNKPANAA